MGTGVANSVGIDDFSAKLSFLLVHKGAEKTVSNAVSACNSLFVMEISAKLCFPFFSFNKDIPGADDILQ